MHSFEINGRKVGKGYPAYIIAEMSANHAQSLERAKEIIHAAKACGADCIKIQTYTPDTLTIDCHNQYFEVKNGTWEGENLYSLYGKAYTPWEWQQELKEEADKVGIDFLSTPFDETAVDFLENIGCSFYKVASFEMIHLPLLKYIASKGKPIIMSTGMGSKEEIREAVEAVYETGNRQLAILKCTSAYPAEAKDMNLRTLQDMEARFDTVVGLSDHSLGYDAAVAAVALGGCIIEKHFCLSREIKNPDSSFSMTPEEFGLMVQKIRYYEQMMGTPTYGISSQEESSVVFRRSIFAVSDMKKGDIFTKENIRIIRPGYGIKPKYITDILGQKADRDIAYGTPMSFDMLEPGRVLFLTNNENTADLYEWLQEQGESVMKFTNKLDIDIIKKLAPSFVISFNYRHLVPKDVVAYMQGRIINLHTSLLPFNRGSSPNFFSFYDNTPKGVTIQEMGVGLDTGAILVQKGVTFDENKETFESTYQALLLEMKNLFKENWEDLKAGKIEAKPQREAGTYHTMKELNQIREKTPFTWNEIIADVKKRFSK